VNIVSSVPCHSTDNTVVNIVSSVPCHITDSTAVNIVSSVPCHITDSTAVNIVSSVPCHSTDSTAVNIVSSVPCHSTDNTVVNIVSSVPCHITDSTAVNIVSSGPCHSTDSAVVNIVSSGPCHSTDSAVVNTINNFDKGEDGFKINSDVCNTAADVRNKCQMETVENELDSDKDELQQMAVVSDDVCEDESLYDTDNDGLQQVAVIMDDGREHGFICDANVKSSTSGTVNDRLQQMAVVNDYVSKEHSMYITNNESVTLDMDIGELQQMVLVDDICNEEVIYDANDKSSNRERLKDGLESMELIIDDDSTDANTKSSKLNVDIHGLRPKTIVIVDDCEDESESIDQLSVDVGSSNNSRHIGMPVNVPKQPAIIILDKSVQSQTYTKPVANFNDVFVNMVRSQNVSSAANTFLPILPRISVAKSVSRSHLPMKTISSVPDVIDIPDGKPEVRPVAKLLCDISVELIGEKVCREVMESQSTVDSEMTVEDKVSTRLPAITIPFL